ncbi:unnamed protein product, partial [Heterotrigona itama]
NVEQQQIDNAGQRNAERFLAFANVEAGGQPVVLRLPLGLALSTLEKLPEARSTHAVQLADSFEGSEYRRFAGSLDIEHVPFGQLTDKSFLCKQEHEFKCSGPVERTGSECSAEPQCPHPCRCADGIVDCRENSLTKVPTHLPEDTTELFVHVTLSRALRVELPNVPPSMLLNANEISCIRTDLFRDLTSLTLLSLYDNNIRSLANGTFANLRSIETLHLARNPFICDCNLRWLNAYLHAHPIETSGAKCESPKRAQKRKIDSMRDDKFKCKGDEELLTKRAGECILPGECPEPCVCNGATVDCSNKKLTTIPRELPIYTSTLLLANNELDKIKADGLFEKLPELQHLDLRKNKISRIEASAFSGAHKLTDL